jgi:hypothetical protein
MSKLTPTSATKKLDLKEPVHLSELPQQGLISQKPARDGIFKDKISQYYTNLKEKMSRVSSYDEMNSPKKATSICDMIILPVDQ